jgi:hypothetical protein
MPYKTTWVSPEQFMRHKGQRVFHLYKDDEIDQCRRRFHYALDVNESDYEGGFDVRELSPYKNLARLEEETEDAFQKRVIRVALDSGELYLDGDQSAIREPEPVLNAS